MHQSALLPVYVFLHPFVLEQTRTECVSVCAQASTVSMCETGKRYVVSE